MRHGITEHPEQYKGLTASSSFKQVLAELYRRGDCHVSELDAMDCYKRVCWVMKVGISAHPSWYPQLHQNSSFEEVQGVLYTRGECQFNMEEAGPCYKGAAWVLLYGVVQHPEWYPTLDQASSIDEVIADLQSKGQCHLLDDQENPAVNSQDDQLEREISQCLDYR